VYHARIRLGQPKTNMDGSVIIIIIFVSMLVGAIYYGTTQERKGGNDVPGGCAVGFFIGALISIIVLIIWLITSAHR
jgi:hypothetical protein